MSQNNPSHQHSKDRLPIHFLEPSSDLTREHFIQSKLRKTGPDAYPQIDSEGIKNQLKAIREAALANIETNVGDLTAFLQDRGVRTFYAERAKDAAAYIEEVLKESGIDGICINNSSQTREVITGLDKNIEIVDTYNASIKDIENKTHLDYWEIPKLSEGQIWNSYNVTKIKYKEPHNYAAVLGVIAASSEDGVLFFVQHFNNISNLISQARETILVVGIEKIVKDFEQAKFISNAAGFFGLRSLLLGIMSNETEYQRIHVDQLASKFERGEQGEENNIHVVILDNGRKDMLDSEFSEFLQCINCRACGAVCPRSLLKEDMEFRTPRELVLLRFSGGLGKTVEQGLYNCSLCGSCELACPLSIPLPDFLLKIREEAVEGGLIPKKHQTIGENVKAFGNPYGRGD